MTHYDIALTMIPRLGVRGVVKLLEVFLTAEKIFHATFAELTHFAELNPVIAKSIVDRVSIEDAQREMAYCMRNNITPIASTDDGYPELLKMIPDYPHVIYVKGNIEALSCRSVSIVGTRRITSYGDRMCHNLVDELSARLPDVSIVSGLAFGVDGSAHRSALHRGITTVAVVACALPGVTPTQHTALAEDIVASGGAILSEYHSQCKQNGNFYIARNRIIAALSPVTVIVESPITGGSMATAGFANSYDRTVMAFPARVGDSSSAGCNMLIRNNQAQLLLSADQLIREMMWDSASAVDRPLLEPIASEFSLRQRHVMESFTTGDPLTIDRLVEISCCEVNDLTVILMELEMMGAVRMLPGSRYEPLITVVAR
ncbi:MAG: DNA-processing protein DprA [Rikenellaceae bacterium]